MTERRQRRRAAKASYDLVSAERAEELTTELVQLLPAEWKDADVTAAGLEGLRTRDDCKALLARITRSVPMRLLVEHGPRSLHRCEKEHLTPSHFLLSVPVEKLRAFVSHRWAADPPCCCCCCERPARPAFWRRGGLRPPSHQLPKVPHRGGRKKLPQRLPYLLRVLLLPHVCHNGCPRPRTRTARTPAGGSAATHLQRARGAGLERRG